MKYKAVLSDFDGTIAGEFQQVSKKHKDIISLYKKKGGVFSVISGGMWPGAIKNFCEELNLNTFQIVDGGSQFIFPKDKTKNISTYISEISVRNIMESLKNYPNLYYFAICKTNFYSVAKQRYKWINYNGQIKDIKAIPHDQINKLCIPPGLNEHVDTSAIGKSLNHNISDVSIQYSGNTKNVAVDILPKGVSKESAVAKYCEYMNLQAEEIIAIGDSANDIPLFNACGYSIAIGDASDKVKSIC